MNPENENKKGLYLYTSENQIKKCRINKNWVEFKRAYKRNKS